MKMRKTVYPVAIIVAIPLVIILFIVLNQGHFEQVMNTAELQNEKTVEGYYIWEGFGKPKIKSVEISEEEKSMNQFDYHTNNDVKKMAPDSLEKDLEKQKSILAVQIETNEKEEVQMEHRFIVHYSIFGLNREQEITLGRGVDSN